MIAIDWGTTSFRAFRIADGKILDQRQSASGIMQVAEGRFAEALSSTVRPWLEQGETRILMSGMIGSRQGWVEAPYLPCPAGLSDIAARLTRVPFAEADLRIVPGLCSVDPAGIPEVMRGEETQVFGAQAEGLVCLPGSHAKWAAVRAGRIARFDTYLSGEAFAALRQGTILGRMMPEAPPDDAAFDRGVSHAGQPGHLLHHLFGVRTQGLMGTLSPEASASYLSGLLIGHEVRAALPAAASPAGSHVTLLGNAALCALYARAIAACGGTSTIGPEQAAALGLAAIGDLASWD